MQALEKVPVDSKTDMPRDEVKIVSIDIMDTHDAGELCRAQSNFVILNTLFLQILPRSSDVGVKMQFGHSMGA